MRAVTLRRLRPWVQGGAFVLFLVVTLAGGRIAWLPADLFFRLDPLVGLAGMIAARRWVPALAVGGLVMLALTLVTGRVWCGWLCPLGTLFDGAQVVLGRRSDRASRRVSDKANRRESDKANRRVSDKAKRRESDEAKGRESDEAKGRRAPERLGEEAERVGIGPGWRQVKHFLLAAILVAALLGNLSLIALDPITLLTRTLAVAGWPATGAIITGAEQALVALPVPWVADAVVAVDTLLRSTVLPMVQPVYGLGWLAALIFVGVLALEAVRPRFWCRYLCPLGALLGLVSKVSWLRRRVMAEKCVACGACARVCPTGTIGEAAPARASRPPGVGRTVLFARDKARNGSADEIRRQAPSGEGAEAERASRSDGRRPRRSFESDPAECIMCLECAGACAFDAQTFRGAGVPVVSGVLNPAPAQAYDPSRRQFLASAGAAVALVGLSAVEPVAERTPAHLLRPPGAVDPEFLSQCVRCGICVKVCPTSALQPSLTTGWSGLWTPVLVPRIGYCDYSCNACGQACPTGAIPPLALAEKRQTVMGHAYVDRNRCLPWASGRSCITCEEMCPVPQKAIQLIEAEVVALDGTRVTLKRPVVVQERCIGCGICENHCPLEGQAAIRVYAPTDLGV